MQFTSETLPDTTLMLAVDVLITAWLHVILDTSDEYMADYDSIERMTFEFYLKFRQNIPSADAVKISPY
jgi:hypothetical protein